MDLRGSQRFSYVFAGTKPELPCAAQRVLHRLPAVVWCALLAELGLCPFLSLCLLLQAIEELNRKTGSHIDPLADPNEIMKSSTRNLMSAVSSLPELTGEWMALGRRWEQYVELVGWQLTGRTTLQG